MKLLIFGDVVGKPGRSGVKRMLPIWRKKFSPDIVIANIENIAHGKGIGIKQISELRDAGVDIFTGGNHSLEGKDFDKILNDEMLPIIRPANMQNAPGRGVLVHSSKNNIKLLVINLIGQVHMKQQYENPFHTVDKILEEYDHETPYKIMDWHAEATSEKTVMGWYLDGKVSLVYGTHTHVPTADAKILPHGTAYISDIGMTGPANSIIGVEIESAFKRFNPPAGGQEKTSLMIEENGPVEVNAIFVELKEASSLARQAAFVEASAAKAVDIKHLREILPEDRI